MTRPRTFPGVTRPNRFDLATASIPRAAVRFLRAELDLLAADPTVDPDEIRFNETAIRQALLRFAHWDTCTDPTCRVEASLPRETVKGWVDALPERLGPVSKARLLVEGHPSVGFHAPPVFRSSGVFGRAVVVFTAVLVVFDGAGRESLAGVLGDEAAGWLDAFPPAGLVPVPPAAADAAGWGTWSYGARGFG